MSGSPGDDVGGPGPSPPSAGQAAEVVRALSHVAIATPDADVLAATLMQALGGRRGEEEMLDGGALRVVFIHLGPVTLELLEPRDANHTVAKFLEKRGPGLHHVSLDVGDIGAALEKSRSAGLRLIDEMPRAGAHGSQVAFLHPSALGGVLFELCQSGKSPEGTP